MYFVSFPRAGSHWVQAIFEIYFERPRLPRSKDVANRLSWLSEKDENKTPLWTHTHDKKLNINPTTKDILLIRDPLDSIYSLIQITKKSHTENILEYMQNYKNFHDKWIPNAKLVLHYENFTKEKNALSEMKKVSKLLDEPSFRKEDALFCYKFLDKKTILTKSKKSVWHNEKALKPEYEQGRKIFKDKWSKTAKEKGLYYFLNRF